MSYYINKQLPVSFEEGLKIVNASLEREGFAVISEIRIDEKFKAKLGVNFRKYKILGACSPAHAYEALKHEDKIGTMLPCNVIVQEIEPGLVEIAAVDPIASMQAVENSNLGEIASEIRDKLVRVISHLDE